jgi:hypothetical protein
MELPESCDVVIAVVPLILGVVGLSGFAIRMRYSCGVRLEAIQLSFAAILSGELSFACFLAGAQ